MYTLFVCLLGAAILLVGRIRHHSRKTRQVQAGKVYLPEDFAVVGTAMTVVMIGFAIDAFFFANSPDVAIIFFAFAIVTSMFIVAYANYQITYDEDGFVVKNIFGKKRTYTYEQLTAIKEEVHERYIFVGKKKITVARFIPGDREFIEFARTMYRTSHDGQELPEVQPSKRDIFKGNVRDVKGRMIEYGVLTVVAVAMMIFALVECYTPSTVNNTIKHTVQLSYCEVRDDRIVLFSADDRVYTIGEIDEQIDAKPFQILSACQETVTIYFTEGKPQFKDQTPPYFVKAIVHEGETVLSFEETDRLHRQVAIWLVVVAGGLCLLIGGYIVCEIIVSRNPQKFSKRIVKFVFRERRARYFPMGNP